MTTKTIAMMVHWIAVILFGMVLADAGIYITNIHYWLTMILYTISITCVSINNDRDIS